MLEQEVAGRAATARTGRAGSVGSVAAFQCHAHPLERGLLSRAVRALLEATGITHEQISDLDALAALRLRDRRAAPLLRTARLGAVHSLTEIDAAGMALAQLEALTATDGGGPGS